MKNEVITPLKPRFYRRYVDDKIAKTLVIKSTKTLQMQCNFSYLMEKFQKADYLLHFN